MGSNNFLKRSSLLHLDNTHQKNLDSVLGYEEQPTFDSFFARYMRQSIAYRIINAFPEATWGNPPRITDINSLKMISSFENAFNIIAKKINLFHYLNRLDKLTALGQYGVLLLGVRDGKSLDSPIGTIKGPDDILYCMPFSQNKTEIESYDEDPSSARYGLPIMYKITMGGYGHTNSMKENKNFVHYSRLIHTAEGCLENDVFGTPKLLPVINALDDLKKVVGGSAEIYWINGRGGLHLKSVGDWDMENPESVEEAAQQYTKHLSRVIKTHNIDVNTLEMSVHPPDAHFSVIIDLISGAMGIPKRILLGSERNRAASSQDEKNWWNRVQERCKNYLQPKIINPLIDLLINIGALPPVKEYQILWNDFNVTSDLERADISMRIANSINAYTNSKGGELIVPVKQFVEEVLNLPCREGEVDLELFMERKEMEADLNNLSKRTPKKPNAVRMPSTTNEN